MDNNKKPQRNLEKEVALLQEQIMMVISDKVMVQAMLDDALEELDQIKNGNQEVAE